MVAKSCTTWDGRRPINNGINHLLVQHFFHPRNSKFMLLRFAEPCFFARWIQWIWDGLLFSMFFPCFFHVFSMLSWLDLGFLSMFSVGKLLLAQHQVPNSKTSDLAFSRASEALPGLVQWWRRWLKMTMFDKWWVMRMDGWMDGWIDR